MECILQLEGAAVPTLPGATLIRLRRLLKKPLEEMLSQHSTSTGLGYHPQNSSRPLAKRRKTLVLSCLRGD